MTDREIFTQIGFSPEQRTFRPLPTAVRHILKRQHNGFTLMASVAHMSYGKKIEDTKMLEYVKLDCGIIVSGPGICSTFGTFESMAHEIAASHPSYGIKHKIRRNGHE